MTKNIETIQKLVAADLTSVVTSSKRFEMVLDNLDVESFPTKAAQKELLDLLNRAYSTQERAIQNLILMKRDQGDLDGNSEEFNKLYYEKPYDLHNWRPKHSALYAPFAKPQVQIIDGLFEMREIIKAKPVVKTTAAQVAAKKRAAGKTERIQKRAICSICGRDIAVDENGIIHDHGYRVLGGWGSRNGSCSGVNHYHFGTLKGAQIAERYAEMYENHAKTWDAEKTDAKNNSMRRQFAAAASDLRRNLANWEEREPVEVTVFD